MAALTEIFDKPRVADGKRGDSLLPNGQSDNTKKDKEKPRDDDKTRR